MGFLTLPRNTITGQQCSFNFGKTPFAYPHPNSDYKVLHCFLSEAEVEKLNQLFNKYKGKVTTTTHTRGLILN